MGNYTQTHSHITCLIWWAQGFWSCCKGAAIFSFSISVLWDVVRERFALLFSVILPSFKQTKENLPPHPPDLPPQSRSRLHSRLRGCVSLPPRRVFVSVTPRASVAATSGLKLYKVYKYVNIQREAPCVSTRPALFFPPLFFHFLIHAVFFLFFLRTSWHRPHRSLYANSPVLTDFFFLMILLFTFKHFLSDLFDGFVCGLSGNSVHLLLFLKLVVCSVFWKSRWLLLLVGRTRRVNFLDLAPILLLLHFSSFFFFFLFTFLFKQRKTLNRQRLFIIHLFLQFYSCHEENAVGG